MDNWVWCKVFKEISSFLVLFLWVSSKTMGVDATNTKQHHHLRGPCGAGMGLSLKDTLAEQMLSNTAVQSSVTG